MPTPPEVTLAMSTLVQMVVPDAPQNLIGDNAYDSDRLDTQLRLCGIEVIAPHRRNRRASTQDGRRPKRYRRRWKMVAAAPFTGAHRAEGRGFPRSL